MRLLNVHSRKFEEFDEAERPEYAILSHTWIRGQEVSHAEFLEDDSGSKSESYGNGRKSGFEKINLCCLRALADGLSYVWIDTCCIDKSSSAELSEAINSMFSWYQGARVCYAYLSDVFGNVDDDNVDEADIVFSGEDDGGYSSSSFGAFSEQKPSVNNAAGSKEQTENEVKVLPFPRELFRASRWWLRGWTLQELIAPDNVIFFDHDWTLLGEKTTMAGRIAHITGIDGDILRGKRSCRSASIAKRMSWASGRQTTRPEDEAYCLMGLFDVNMSMIYGEGRKAFVRLQEEIMRHSDDQSIFAWTDPDADGKARSGLLAPSPVYFRNSASVVPFVEQEGSEPFAVSNKGLSIELHLSHIWGKKYFRASLCCRLSNKLFYKHLCICLEKVNPRQYFRILPQKHIQAQNRGELQRLYVPQVVNSSVYKPVAYIELREGPPASTYQVERVQPVTNITRVTRLDSTHRTPQDVARRESEDNWISKGTPFRWRLDGEPGTILGHVTFMHKPTGEKFTVSLGSNWESGLMFDVDAQSQEQMSSHDSETTPAAEITLTRPANTSCLVNDLHKVETNVEWVTHPWAVMCFVDIRIQERNAVNERRDVRLSTASLEQQA